MQSSQFIYYDVLNEMTHCPCRLPSPAPLIQYSVNNLGHLLPSASVMKSLPIYACSASAMYPTL